MRISISNEEDLRIKKQKRINLYLSNVRLTNSKIDPYTYHVKSGSKEKEYMVYFSIRKERWLCDCTYAALYPEKECIHIATVRYYIRVLNYIRTDKNEIKNAQLKQSSLVTKL